MSDKIAVCINWNGRIVKSDQWVEFECPTPKLMLVKPDFTIGELKTLIRRKMKLGPQHRISQIFNRLPKKKDMWGKKIGFRLQTIDDDEDIEIMLIAYKKYKLEELTLYVECETVTQFPNCDTLNEGGTSMGSQHLCGHHSNYTDDVPSSYPLPNIDPTIETQQSAPTPFQQRTSNPLDTDEGVNGGEDNLDTDFSDGHEDTGDMFGDEPHPIPQSEDNVAVDLADDEQGLLDALDDDAPMAPGESMPLAVAPEQMVPVGGGEVTYFQPPSQTFSEINWDAMNSTDDMPEVDYSGHWNPEDELYVGVRFADKETASNALKHYSIIRHCTYRVVDSDSRRLYVKCPRFGEGCQWMARVSVNKRAGCWRLTRYNGPHTCLNPDVVFDHRQLDIRMISTCILGMVKLKPNVEVALIIERIQEKFMHVISYRKAWLAKQKAIEKIFGGWDESFALLPRWLMAMSQEMPGTVVDLQTFPVYDEKRTLLPNFRYFRRAFWMFPPSVHAFKFCKPILQIDATHLYGKYKMKLLIATTQDGARSLLPVAFAIVNAETKDNWGWFLDKIRQHLT